MNDPRGRPVAAGFAYYLVAFLFGFAFGVLRTLVLEPRLGMTAALYVELPVMLALSWLICGRFVKVFSVPPRDGSRAIMGGLAFLLLLTSELVLVRPLLGMTVVDYVHHLGTPPGITGLAGQVIFGFIPILHGAVAR